MRISKYSEHGLEYVELENEKIRTTWLPELGGKLVSFFDKTTSSELLYAQESFASLPSLPKYGARYNEYIFPGLDECFPTIDASDYSPAALQSTKKNMHLPEHGEVWALPWNSYYSNNELIFRIQGVVFNYELEKHIQLRDQSVHLTYFLTNNESFSIDYIWATYADIEITNNDQLLLESSIAKDLNNDSVSSSNPGNNGSSQNITMEDLVSGNLGTTLKTKILSKSLELGYCGIQRQDDQKALFLQFDKQEFSHLAIQFSTEMANTQKTNFHVRLMPSIGLPGSLSEAIQTENYNSIEPQTRRHWNMILKSEQDAIKHQDLVAIECHR